MNEEDAIRIAMDYATENGLEPKRIERVTFVDSNKLPEPYKHQGSFWVVAFVEPEQLDTVDEHSGTVLNIRHDNEEVRIVR